MHPKTESVVQAARVGSTEHFYAVGSFSMLPQSRSSAVDDMTKTECLISVSENTIIIGSKSSSEEETIP